MYAKQISERAERKSYMMGWEKVPCELKGLVKQRHALTKISAR